MTIRARTHRGRAHRGWAQHGFTLIETMLVAMILGILAAIVLPSFLDQKDKSHDAAAKAYVRGAVGAMEAFAADHDSYDATTAEVLELAPELRDASGWSASGTK